MKISVTQKQQNKGKLEDVESIFLSLETQRYIWCLRLGTESEVHFMCLIC